MTIGIKEISGIKKKNEIISELKREHDFKISKLNDFSNGDSKVKPSCGELKLDVYRDAEYLYIICQIAGVRKEHVKLTLNYDVLLIEGRQYFPLGEGPFVALAKECNWGEFRRRIVLPEDIDTNALKANFDSGLLIISIPIIEKAKMKVIEIN